MKSWKGKSRDSSWAGFSLIFSIFSSDFRLFEIRFFSSTFTLIFPFWKGALWLVSFGESWEELKINFDFLWSPEKIGEKWRKRVWNLQPKFPCLILYPAQPINNSSWAKKGKCVSLQLFLLPLCSNRSKCDFLEKSTNFFVLEWYERNRRRVHQRGVVLSPLEFRKSHQAFHQGTVLSKFYYEIMIGFKNIFENWKKNWTSWQGTWSWPRLISKLGCPPELCFKIEFFSEKKWAKK